MSIYIMKPWYKAAGAKTTTFEIITQSFEQQEVTSSYQYGGDVSTYNNTKRLFNNIFLRGASYISSNSGSYTNSRGPSSPWIPGGTSYSTVKYSRATLSIPAIKTLGNGYSSSNTFSKSTFSKWSSTARSRMIYASNSTTSRGYIYSTYGGTTMYVDMHLWLDRSNDFRSGEYFPLGVTSYNLINTSICSLIPGYNTYNQASQMLLADMIYNAGFETNNRIFSGYGTATYYLPNDESGTLAVWYPRAFVKYSDPSQIQQVIYSGRDYLLVEGTLSETK